MAFDRGNRYIFSTTYLHGFSLGLKILAVHLKNPVKDRKFIYCIECTWGQYNSKLPKCENYSKTTNKRLMCGVLLEKLDKKCYDFHMAVENISHDTTR